jgi:Protein of unknown function (DUF1393).
MKKNNKMTLKNLVIIAMLMALEIVLARFCSIGTPTIRIGFGFVPMALCGMLFGPLWTGACYGIADLLGAALFSIGVNPLIVIARVCSGIIFGLFLHRENLKFFPIMVLTTLCDQIICSLGITTYALATIYGNTYIAMMIIRLPQVCIMIVVQLVTFPILVQIRTALQKAHLLPDAA